MDILLVQVSNEQIVPKDKAQMPPLGLLYLYTNIKKHGYKSDVLDLNVHMGNIQNHLKILIERINRDNPKIIGFSSFTLNYYSYKYLCNKIKTIFPQITIFYGGCHASFTINQSMKESSVDVIIKREGEETIIELLKYFIDNEGCINDIKGIAYREEDKIIETEDRPLIKDLDRIPIPDRSILESEKYEIFGTILTSRGCIGKCTFCSAEAMSGGKYRIRSSESVCEEIEILNKEFGVKELSFIDNTFTVFGKRTKKICKLLMELQIKWDCESRIDCINKDILNEMVKSGCQGIQYGIESGDNRVLKDIKKLITVDQVRKIVKLTLDSGVKTVFCGFIVGHPTDTKESIMNTFSLARDLVKVGAFVGVKISTPFPGTQLEKEIEKQNMMLKTNNWSQYNLNQPIYETPYISSRELHKLYTHHVEELTRLIQIKQNSLN